jgi:hypothetical protein
LDTIIKDGGGSNVQLIVWTLPNSNSPSRLTGIEFQDGGRVNRYPDNGLLRVAGSNTSGATFRMDHCYWNNVNGPIATETVIGVIDHVNFLIDKGTLPIIVWGTYWDGGTFGDKSWVTPAGFGSSQFLFIEDCDFTHHKTVNQGITDAYTGARFVVRHCTIYSGIIGNHGTESSQRNRGGRAMEVYNNTWT